MEEVEFYTSPEGLVYYKKDGQDPKRLSKFSEVVEPVVTIIRNRFPECYARLATLYKEHSIQMVDRFVRCNFGEHDLLTNDIEHDILNFEEVRCPLRGICKDEHVICKPKSLVHLSKGEQEVVKLYLNGCTLDNISAQLHKNRSTVKTQLLRVRDKLGVKNCREIIRVMRMGGYLL